jgi:hypothetical protein
MDGARTIWQDLETRQSTAATQQRNGLLLAAVLLIALCAAEFVVLRYVAGSAMGDMLMAAEGIPVGE